MKRPGATTIITALSILAVIAIISAYVVISPSAEKTTDPTPESTDSKVYTITYVMNDGTNDENNPASYTAGTVTELRTPTREGYIFTGWYTDSELTDEIDEIGKDMTGDITLYAGWEKSSVGLVLNYEISGTTKSRYMFYNNTNTISGTVTYSYLYYSVEKGYMMSYDETYTVSYGGQGGRTYTDSDTYWTSENDDVVWTKQSGTKTISTFEGQKECEIWVGTDSSHTETQYVGVDSDLAYLIVYEKSSRDSSTSITYTLKSTGSNDVDQDYEVKAYCDKGITVTGSGILDAYSSVTLKATAELGTTFKGWYSESGELLSTSSRYTIDTLLSDVTVYAKNTNDLDVVCDSTSVTISPSIELDDVQWTFTDGNEKTVSSDVLNYTFSEPGLYTISYSGTNADDEMYYGFVDIMADGKVTKTYTWTYDKKTYSTSLGILYSDFYTYRNDDISREQGTAAHDLEFVTYDDKYIVELVKNLKDLGKDMTSLQYANFILAFTQYIEYQYDEDSMGEEEYWKYPVETLFDQNGDCEDTSILFCAIAKASGYDCCMILFTGHMAAGIVVEGASGNTFTSGGVTYYYCETTSSGYSVGDYIKQNGQTVTAYTQNGRGSYFRSLIAVV